MIQIITLANWSFEVCRSVWTNSDLHINSIISSVVGVALKSVEVAHII